MWIRTQNKKELVNVIKVEIAPIYGDIRNKVIIWGRFAANSIFTSNRALLGMYPTMEDAIAEIDEIEKCILNNPNGVYTMKNNEYNLTDDELINIISNKGKIKAIKKYREITGVGLKEAKEYIDKLSENKVNE